MISLPVVAASGWLGRSRPISLVHFITRRCNARCAHCFIDFEAERGEGAALTLAEIEALADSVRSTLVNVNITGGEPFLDPDVWPICEAWFRRGGAASVYVTTHGGFTDRIDAFAGRFLVSDVKGHLFVSISVDNFPDAHDRNRRARGLFARALDTHRRLEARRDARLGVGVSITVAEHNHEQVLDLYRHLRDQHGVDVVTATLRRPAGAAKPLPPELTRRIGAAYAALTRAIEADLGRPLRRGARRSLVARTQDAKDRLLYRMLREDALDGGRYRAPCPAGRLFLVLQPDGAVHGCEVRSDAWLGNVREHGLDLPRLLAAPVARTWRERILAGRCHCSYECALGINIVGNARYLPRLAAGLARDLLHG